MTTLGTLLSGDQTRPFLTYYDDQTGERTELSLATFRNWIAKTANLLVDDLGLGSGRRALVALPAHWQSAAILLGCWSVGLSVRTAGTDAASVAHQTTPDRTAGPEHTPGVRPTETDGVDVAFVTADHAVPDLAAADRYAVGLHPLGLPLREVPAGYLDFVTEVRAHGDVFTATAPREDLVAEAGARADALGLRPGDRVLIDAARYPEPVNWLLAPLAARASIVLCRNLDPGKVPERVAAERVTRTLTGRP